LRFNGGLTNDKWYSKKIMISIGYTKKLIFEIAETMYITDISPAKYADVMGLGWALKGNSHLYGTSWDFCGVLSIQNGKVNQQK
jgi:hypothetical protein